MRYAVLGLALLLLPGCVAGYVSQTVDTYVLSDGTPFMEERTCRVLALGWGQSAEASCAKSWEEPADENAELAMVEAEELAGVFGARLSPEGGSTIRDAVAAVAGFLGGLFVGVP